MKRRQLMLLLGGAMTAATGLRAQKKAVPVIGFMAFGSPVLNPSAGPFHKGLNETGYVDGENVAIEYRWAEDKYDRLPALAADLVSWPVAIIVTTGGNGPALAAKALGLTIPPAILDLADEVIE